METKTKKTQNVVKASIGGIAWWMKLLIRILLVPVYVLRILQEIKRIILRYDKRKVYINVALAGRLPVKGWVTVDQAEDAKHKAVEEAVMTYKKQTNRQWSRILDQDARLRIQNRNLKAEVGALREALKNPSKN